MSMLHIDSRALDEVEGGVVIGLEGALDQSTRDAFLETLKAVLAGGNNRCVLDMSEVTYANSTAIGDIVVHSDLFREAGGALVLVGPQRKVMVIIEMLGVDGVVPVVSTLAEAVARLGGQGSGP